MKAKRVIPDLDADYFEKFPSKLFLLRKALQDHAVQDEHLSNNVLLRRIITSDMTLRLKLESTSPYDCLRNFIKDQGGVKKFLESPFILSSVYVAMAVYNIRIQKEINLETSSFGSLDTHQAQRLLAELLGEQVADVAGAEAYNVICSDPSYRRAEEAVIKYVKQLTNEQADSVKNYLRSYLSIDTQSRSSEKPALISVQADVEPTDLSAKALQLSKFSKAPADESSRNPYKLQQTSRSIQRRNHMSLGQVNEHRFEMSMRELELEKREEAVGAREIAVSLREAAVALRERSLAKRRASVCQDSPW